MTSQEFLKATYHDLLSAFDAGRCPRAAGANGTGLSLDGQYRGWIVAVLGRRIMRLPWLLPRVWSGKRIAGDRIVNRVFGRWTMPGEVHEIPSRVDAEPVLEITYRLPFLSRLRDEMRQVGPDRILGTVFWGRTVVGFFLLEKEGG